MRLYKGIGLLAALFAIASAYAQVTPPGVVFAVEVTAASNGTVTPKATWSTTPAATSCTATGSWSGSKPAAGSEVLPPVTVSQNYILTCVRGTNIIKMDWVPASKNTDGSTLTDLKTTRFYYRLGSETAEAQVFNAEGAGTSTAQMGPVVAGKWFVTATSITAGGVESGPIGPVTVDTGLATASKTVALAVKIPEGPSDVKATAVTQ